MKTNSLDMTKGPLFKKVIIYTIPIIISNLLQLFFNAADIIVVGQYCGSLAVAAVGSNGSLVNLLINIMMGLSVGTGIITAQGIGAKDYKTVEKTVHTAIPTALIIGGLLTVVGFFFSKEILKLMDTPTDVLPLATTYLKIYFLGVISNSIYNFGASILRSAGDTRSPLIFLTVSGILNVLLNLLFVIVFDMGVSGVAIATIASQALSAILVLITLIKRTDCCHLDIRKMKIYKNELMRIIRIGIPSSIQSSMFSISNVIIQSSVNLFGAAAVSGNAAASNIEGFVYTIMHAFHITALNFTGQNAGAGNFKRVKKVLIQNLLSVGIIGAVSGSLVFVFGRPLLALYITDSNSAIEIGIIKLTFVCLPYFLAGVMEVLAGVIKGLGDTVYAMITSLIGVCGFRLFWVFTIFQIEKCHNLRSLFVSYPISWIFTIILYIFAYFRIMKSIKNRFKINEKSAESEAE